MSTRHGSRPRNHNTTNESIHHVDLETSNASRNNRVESRCSHSMGIPIPAPVQAGRHLRVAL